ncbi:MAG TPA: hypothetical protein VGI73_09090 [Solirubrobacterales bacterium]|jgi:hypothetical protein
MSLTWAKGNGGRYPYLFCLGRTRGTGCKQPYVPVDLIETAVERVYGDVRLPAPRSNGCGRSSARRWPGMREEAETEVAVSAAASRSSARSARSCCAPTTPRPCRSTCSSQSRSAIRRETAQAERQIEVAEASLGDTEDTLDQALDLLADCERAYKKAPCHLRRQWNQALF